MSTYAKAPSAPPATGRRTHHLASGFLALFFAALLLALSAAPASASLTRPAASFSPIDGAATGVFFGKPSGVAIDETANPGNLAVSDSFGGTVDLFGPEGEVPPGVASPYQLSGFSFFGEPSGVAIDNSASASAGALYVAAAGAPHLSKYELNASEEYELSETLSPDPSAPPFGEVLGVAVDPTSGNVWVADFANGLWEFSPAGVEIKRITSTSTPSGVAVDSEGDLFASQYGSGAVFKYAANGSGEVEADTTPTEIRFFGATGIAVDPATDTLFTAIGDRVVQYDAITGAEGIEFGAGALGHSEGLAVDSQANRVYVADGAKQNVAVFGAPAILPDATTAAADPIAATTATLKGSVDPDSVALADCHFEYTDEDDFLFNGFANATDVPCTPDPGSGPDPVAVAADVSGLDADASYEFRLVATNANGTTTGQAQSLHTDPAVKDLATNPASALTATTATLNGTLDPDGVAITDCHFEYTDEADFQANGFANATDVPCTPDPGSGPGPVAVAADVSGLDADAAYEFRLLATNANGTTTGQAQSLHTDPAVKDLATNPASALTATTATLNGTLDPDGIAISDCHFEYTDEDDFQANAFANATDAPCIPPPGSGSGPAAVSAFLSGLDSATTYEFRLAATNANGTVVGQAQSFTTATIATTKAPTLIHHTSAILNGHLDPNVDPAITECHFEWGTTTAYGNSAPCSEGNDFSAPADVSAALTGFTPGTAIHYRLVVSTTSLGDFQGDDKSFTFAPFPSVRDLLPSFGAPGQGDGQFGGLQNLAVDQSSGEVYVADAGNHRIERFGADGAFISAWGWGVDDGSAAFQVCTSGCQAGAAGSGPGQFDALKFIAIDNSGGPSNHAVYVADTATNLIQKFDAAGNLVSGWGTGGQLAGTGPESFLPLAGITVDGDGNLDVLQVDGEPHHVLRFAEDGSFIEAVEIPRGNAPNGLAVDQDGNIFKVNGQPSVEKIQSDGTDVGQVDRAERSAAIAIDPSSGDLYVANSETHAIDRYAFNEDGEVIEPDSTCAVEPFGGGDGVACKPTETFGAADLTQPVGVAVRGSDGRVYVADAATGTIRVFGPPAVRMGPTLTAGEAEVIGNTGATLHAKVDPEGFAVTDCHFEYGITTAYGQSVPCAQDPGSGSGDVAVSAEVSGLAPGFTYHFRIAAANANPGGSATGPDRIFTLRADPPPPLDPCPNDALRTGAGIRLPDCRAYEQASPVDKHGAEIQHSVQIVQASSSGDSITFADPGGLPTSGGTSDQAPYLALRGSAGWSTDGLLPATAPGFGANLLGWSDDLSTSLSVVPGAHSLYLGDTATHSWSQAFTDSACCANTFLAGFAGDTSHVIFQDALALALGAIGGKDNLYDLDHGAITLAGRVPVFPATGCDDSAGPACVPPAEGAFAGPYDWRLGGSNLALDQGGPARNYYTQNTISDDGSKVFFTESGTGRLYMRKNATATTQISASKATPPDPNGPKPAAFMAATPDGSKVYFTSCERLTTNATAHSTGENSCTGASQGSDLYSYDTSSGTLTDLTVDSDSNPLGADVRGFLGMTADGSDLYFVANGVLADGASPGNCLTGVGGGGFLCNLYLLHDGAITFVAQLDGSRDTDGRNWQPFFDSDGEVAKTSRVAADGTLVFLSQRQLTDYDNVSAGCAPFGGVTGPCAEIYRYRPGDPAPSCVSCDPGGAPPITNASLESSLPVLGASGTPFLTRNVSADGNRVFFESPDALVGGDTNGDSGCPPDPGGIRSCQDVYEWEAEGTGSCESSSQNGGCLYLISTGTGSRPAYLGDISASGDDAFFFTEQALVPQDTDALVDAYDARVGGGLISQHPAAPPVPCVGEEACKGASPAAPSESSPGTSTFSGPGNPPQKQCKKHGKKCKKQKKQKKKRHHKRQAKRAGHSTGRASR